MKNVKDGPDRESAWRDYEHAKSSDYVLLDRALGILHRMATERTGWRRFFSRWYYSDEPLRNDAANLVREAGFGMMMPLNSQLIGDDAVQRAVDKAVKQALTDNG